MLEAGEAAVISRGRRGGRGDTRDKRKRSRKVRRILNINGGGGGERVRSKLHRSVDSGGEKRTVNLFKNA